MALSNKLVIAGFVAILGVVLLVYANPRARLKAGFFGLLLAACVIGIPFLKKEDTIPEKRFRANGRKPRANVPRGGHRSPN